MHKKIILTSKKLNKQQISGMPRTMIESPLGGDYQRNVEYAKLAMRHSLLMRGESPMAFHLLYTQCLCDNTDLERSVGIKRSFEWHTHAETKAFYIDRGFSNGMLQGYLDAQKKGIKTEFRTVSSDPTMISLVCSLNGRFQTQYELLSLSSLLKKLMKGSKKRKVGMDGDCNDFRSENASALNIIQFLEEDIRTDNAESIANKRLLLRQSLLERNESPLDFDLLYIYFLETKYIYTRNEAMQSWINVADEIADNRKISDKNLDIDKEIIRRINNTNYNSVERAILHDISPSF